MPNIKITPITKICEHCKEPFETGGRGRPKKDQRYCGMRCNALARTVKPKIKHLSSPERAYIAGLFDGEGSIIIWDRGYGGRAALRCTVSNTFEEVHNWLLKATGTGSVVRHVHPAETGYKDSLTWQCYGQNAVSLLKQILPHLIIKREKALAAIDTQNPRKWLTIRHLHKSNDS